jgi:hypothetical protein
LPEGCWDTGLFELLNMQPEQPDSFGEVGCILAICAARTKAKAEMRSGAPATSGVGVAVEQPRAPDTPSEICAARKKAKEICAARKKAEAEIAAARKRADRGDTATSTALANIRIQV